MAELELPSIKSLKTALKDLPPGYEGDFNIHVSRHSMLRLADNSPVGWYGRDIVRVRARAVQDKKMGYSMSTDISAESVKNVMKEAVEAAEASSSGDKYSGLPLIKETPFFSNRNIKSTHKFPEGCVIDQSSMKQKAKLSFELCSSMKDSGLSLFGNIETSNHSRMSISTLADIRQASWHMETFDLSSCRDDVGTGRSFWASDLNLNDSEEYNSALNSITEDLMLYSSLPFKSTCDETINDEGLTSGRVVLMPGAFSVLIDWLAMGLSWKAVNTGNSWASDLLGQQISAQFFSLIDDTYQPDMINRPFDHEGIPRHKLKLIERGKLSQLAHDFRSAHEAGLPDSTGHALMQPNNLGGIPRDMIVVNEIECCDLSRESMTKEADVLSLIRELGDGLIINQLHYIGITDRREGIITGTTRDGTIAVKNGKPCCLLPPLRFKLKFSDFFNSIEALGNFRRYCPLRLEGGVLLPAVLSGGFQYERNEL